MYILLLWLGIRVSMPLPYFVILGLFWAVKVLEFLESKLNE